MKFFKNIYILLCNHLVNVNKLWLWKVVISYCTGMVKCVKFHLETGKSKLILSRLEKPYRCTIVSTEVQNLFNKY